MNNILKVDKEIQPSFYEVDSIHFVWHGHYVKYFEDGREHFGQEYGLRYQDFFDQGLVTPIVKMNLDYKKPLKYGDKAVVETTYVDSAAAKLIFDYKIYSLPDREIVCTGRTVQVFLTDQDRKMLLTNPSFFEGWKKKWLN